MKALHFCLFLFVFSGFALFAAKKPDAKSIRLQHLSAANTTETSADFTSVEKDKAFVRMFHNDESIKVQILVPDQSMQTKFLMQGLNVYLDISGKKSKKYCVQFPKPERPQMQRNIQQPREAGQQNANRQERMPVDMNQMSTLMNPNNTVLVSKGNKTVLNAESVNIQRVEENKLLFTVYLPLSLLGDKIGKNKIISVGLSSEMETPQDMGRAGSGMGGPPGGGMGSGQRTGSMDGSSGEGMRPGGSGGGGARPMGSGGAFAEMSTPFKAWVTFVVD